MDTSFYKIYFEIEKDHWWFRVRRNILISLLKKYKISKTDKIFDFGCGSGFNVKFLQEKGFNVYGSDISEEAIEFGRRQGIKNIKVDSKENNIGESDNSLDLILVLDVIEHIKDDKALIRNIEKALKPGGLAIITVPAYMWLWGAQDEVAHHYRRYTRNFFVNMVKDTSHLQVIRKTYFNTFLFPGIALIRLASRFLGLKNRESDFDIGNRFLNKIFYLIFNLESKLLKYISYPFGVSILLILEKRNGYNYADR